MSPEEARLEAQQRSEQAGTSVGFESGMSDSDFTIKRKEAKLEGLKSSGASASVIATAQKEYDEAKAKRDMEKGSGVTVVDASTNNTTAGGGGGGTVTMPVAIGQPDQRTKSLIANDF